MDREADRAYGSETTELAWRTHYTLLALCRMHEATGDSEYLQAAAPIVARMLDQTDERRGVADFRDISGPVWRQGSSSAISRAVLRSSDSTPAVELRCSIPNSDLATVDLQTERNRYSFTLRHPERSPLRLTSVSSSTDDPRFVERVLSELTVGSAGWTARVRGELAPANATERFHEQFAVSPGATGVIAYPIALWARLAQASQHGKIVGAPPVAQVISEIERAIDHHESEWVESDAGWKIPRGTPVPFDGLGLPWNQDHALGATLAELHAMTGAPEYGRKVQQLLARWRGEWEAVRDWKQWRRWPRSHPVFRGYAAEADLSEYTPTYGPFTSWEDLDHGALTAEFIASSRNAGAGLADDDVNRIIHSFRSGMLTDTGARQAFGGEGLPPDRRVDAMRWLGIADAGMARHLYSLLPADTEAPMSPMGLLACAYLNRCRADRLL